MLEQFGVHVGVGRNDAQHGRLCSRYRKRAGEHMRECMDRLALVEKIITRFPLAKSEHADRKQQHAAGRKRGRLREGKAKNEAQRGCASMK